jgi:hypothetical protein
MSRNEIAEALSDINDLREHPFDGIEQLLDRIS